MTISVLAKFYGPFLVAFGCLLGFHKSHGKEKYRSLDGDSRNMPAGPAD